MRSLIADLDGIVWEADASSMTFTFVSEGAADLLGYPPAEWLDDDAFWADHLHPDDRQRVISRFVRTATAGGRFDEEYRFRAKDDTWVWLRDIGHAVKDVHGKPAVLRGLMVEITSRKALEEEAIEAEGRFRRVVERLPAIVYLETVERGPDMPGELLYVSPQVEPILGFTPEEWTSDPIAWARQFHPDDRARIREEYERVEGTGRPFAAEYRMYTRTGDIVWFRDEAVLVRDEQGIPVYWQGVMFDVTAQHESDARVRESEALVRASEQRYRLLVEHLPAIVYAENVADSGLQVVYINSRVEELLGITPAEWIETPGTWQRAIHPDDVETVLEENARVDSTGEPFQMEYRMIATDGAVRWFRDEASLVHDADGTPLFWQGVMIDITARREAEAQLAEAETRYRALVEQNPSITYLDDANPDPEAGGTVYISPQTTTILGYTPQDWYSTPGLWSRIVHPDDRGRLEHGEGRNSSTYRLVAKDGHTVWVHDQARLIADEQGNPKYWQGVLVDITQQRRTEELEHDLESERRESERLRAEDEMKRTFLQAVSHDLRTPLAAILGLALTMERDDVQLTEDETHDYARRIATNARKLDGIVADFLDLERLDRGLATPQLEPVDIGALVRELTANSELVAERRLALDTAPIVVKADASMVERIVENLLGNTIKHTPGDSRIWVRVERQDDGALIVVEDDGPGVPPEERDRIFEAFRQGSGAGVGSGVGLALVSRFAELHDGRAWVEERPGGGASFRVSLASDPSGRPTSRDAADPQPTANGSSADASQA